ncbi:hypothetical protein [Streptomyces hirsutus]|uniref:hypothetical protein n=1 Tax=Streptomyces hirsutus TaxID=35620 RepID=UPI00333421B2
MRHIHGVLNEAGPPQQVTVGHAVAAAIEGIRYGAGEHGARSVHTVFMDRSLDAAYQTPINSPNAPQAHRQIAQAEFNYWQREAAQNPTAATNAALSFSVEQRVQLQSRIGQMVQTGQSFTANLEREQLSSSSGQNPVAAYANNYLPSGTPSQSPASSAPAVQGTPNPSAPARRR